jgi:hypothetical protein
MKVFYHINANTQQAFAGGSKLIPRDKAKGIFFFSGLVAFFARNSDHTGGVFR